MCAINEKDGILNYRPFTNYYLPIAKTNRNLRFTKDDNGVFVWKFGKTVFNAYSNLITDNHNVYDKRRSRMKQIHFTYIPNLESNSNPLLKNYDKCIFTYGRKSKTVGELKVRG